MLPGVMQTGFYGSAAFSATIAVQDMASGTTTGVQDYSSATISGLTPKAVLLIGTGHDIANDPAESVQAQFSMGLVGPSTQYALNARSADGGGSAVCRLIGFDDRTYQVYNNTGGTLKNADGSLIPGGLSLNYSENATFSARASFVAFAGDDCQASVGQVSLGTGTSAISVTGVGFEPDVVILVGVGDAMPNSGATSAFRFSFGICTSDGTQRAVLAYEAEAAANGAPYLVIRNDCTGGQITTTTLNYKLTVGNFASDGFDVTPDASAGSDKIAYLALKFTDRQVKLVDFDTPTSTGSSSITGVGFQPQFVLAVLTMLEALNSHVSTSDNQGGYSFSLIGDEQWSTTCRHDSGAATIDTACNVQPLALQCATATATAGITASLTSFDSDGLTFNYSAVQGTAKKGFMLAIE